MVDMEFIQTEITGLYGNEVIKEMNEIIKLYDIYEGKGQEWNNDELDYIPTKKRTNYIIYGISKSIYKNHKFRGLVETLYSLF